MPVSERGRMTDLGVILISGQDLTDNLARSLDESGAHPWAFKNFIRQMVGLKPGTFIAWIDFVDGAGKQVKRFTRSDAQLHARRIVLGRVTSPVTEQAAPFHEGYPFQFQFEDAVDEVLSPHQSVAEVTQWLNAHVDGLELQPDQLSTLVGHAKSNKVGLFVDGAARTATYFDPPAASTPSSAATAPATPAAPTTAPTSVGKALLGFAQSVDDAGLRFGGLNDDLPEAFLASLVAKRFALLSGLSGSGKTLLARALGQWISVDADEPNYRVVAVRPDWTSPEPLLGYEDALLPPGSDGRRSWTVPETLRFILRARAGPDQLWLLVLDEMNLAHVERYFADVLSGIESGEPVVPNLEIEDGYWRPPPSGAHLVTLPPNLLIVGTVNVDETTYLFSPKVLDRAFTFEFRVTTDELDPSAPAPGPVASAPSDAIASLLLASADAKLHLDRPAPEWQEISDQLRDLHEQLTAVGFEFGHRTLFESLRFAAVLAEAGITDADLALDWIVMTKVLPRLHGSRRQLEAFMADLHSTALGSDAEKPVMPLTARKIGRMLELLRANQFVSFAE